MACVCVRIKKRRVYATITFEVDPTFDHRLPRQEHVCSPPVLIVWSDHQYMPCQYMPVMLHAEHAVLACYVYPVSGGLVMDDIIYH